jgi:hypothetical protein
LFYYLKFSSSFSHSNSSIDRMNGNNRGNHSRLNTSNRLDKSVEKNTTSNKIKKKKITENLFLYLESTNQETKLGPYLLISDSHSIITVRFKNIPLKILSLAF